MDLTSQGKNQSWSRHNYLLRQMRPSRVHSGAISARQSDGVGLTRQA